MTIVSRNAFLFRHLALPALFASGMALAQVSLYDFTQSTETYTEITAADGGYVLGAPGPAGQVAAAPRAYLDPLFPGGIAQNNLAYFTDYSGTLRSGFPIGFDFTFNGDVFDRIGISEVGWISFGKSTDGNEAVWCYANKDGGAMVHGDPFVQSAFTPPGPVPNYKRNRVAGFGNSGLRMQNWSNTAPPGPIGELRMATIGTAPNRVCVIQWKDFGLSGDYAISWNRINFQIRLNENGNTVDVRFGPMEWDHLLSRRVDTQIGLSGRTTEDFNGRITVYEQPAFLYDWNITAPALSTDTTYFVYCHMATPAVGQPNNSGILPPVGLNWRWTAAVCPPPAWPYAIDDISFDYAHATWDPTLAGEYEYYLTDTNFVGGPEVSSGTTNDPEASFFGLDPLTDYYLFVRSICNGVPGAWSVSTHFRTIGGGIINCDGTATHVTYCTHQYDAIDWQYLSADGSQLRLEFLGGFLSSNTADKLEIWIDGTPDSGPATYTVASGDPTGLQYLANSSIWIRITTDVGSCESQNWFLPFEWRIGCKNCTDPLVNFNLGTVDCDNQEYYVDVNIFSMGSSATLSLENNLGLPATVVSTTGVHQAGPFPAGQGVIVTAQNPDNEMCYSASTQLVASPCAIQDCGPTTYTYCYDNDEHSLWAYQGEGSQNIGIRFLGGSMAPSDILQFYRSQNPDDDPNPVVASSLFNSLFTSGAIAGENSLVMELISNSSWSCATPDPVQGSTQPWTYVVACWDGCTQPKATFTDTCLTSTSYMVKVNVTDIGSTGSVTITNTSGAAPVTATATGTYLVGPFQATVPVTVNVEGASILCTWTSNQRNPDCTGVGIDEAATSQLGIWPNPSNGSFRLQLPENTNGITDVQVTDLTGRTVASTQVAVRQAELHLQQLPAGMYLLNATNNGVRYTSVISIQH